MLPTSKSAVLHKKPSSPYQYFGPFDSPGQAEEYITERELTMAYVIELRQP
ncbi:hypothetical protein SEA_LOZINAK_66 [Gordonia phage Lozinak]|uniref:Uncharacterized protein n=3 Tax=Smoothievirus TaxID=1982557 RepID=A0A2D1GG67_9CAUD|nr:hypothetical protein BEN60_gp140 [Gordonia phage Smoothie]YP_009273101.1 hypothetical protein BH768_gp141 [Gordonia phage ClubL]ANA86223.1 hypothetical protein PBI_SMOOTHIE_67 [Gordonia phage Smoothie]ANA86564.1 hypothetical protein PBI_CLUBL_66 [Gordonia phage ClubL]ATN90692.1 hypothetical protein SEA_LOZINAK_66 [Gordonia phage Lozinak]